ncbi:Membrane-bound lytic murein transglycosylase B precursor [Candidatus Liberibacter americanus str. Sao Paulo]|uniref:Membrane-bound lytic murein transglycosylase B n=2 Tax=Candidatus Liberibacter americanus TaxID=309868 RepID=U6B572_9HYPH|nr:Membrane-bound lytic murein transglycosylase B precursor [Candidatus Liberibacter americanus str. Sao Paulo]
MTICSDNLDSFKEWISEKKGINRKVSPVSTVSICSDNPDNFKEWISEARNEAIKKGINIKIVNDIFSNLEYSFKTIELDRKQTIFKLSFDEFLKKVSAASVIENGKSMKRKYSDFLKKVEKNYGVSPGVLMALWGLESKFGTKKGTINTLSALATLSYDCRRSKLFTEQFFTAVSLVNNGTISIDSIGAPHGEIGQFQFLPTNVERFAVDADGDGKADVVNSNLDAIESAANFLKKSGWNAMYGYQPQEPNFKILNRWNASMVYKKTVAYIAANIDGLKIKDVYE